MERNSHTLEPAKLKAGVTLDDLPAERGETGSAASGTEPLRGRALIFWDPQQPGSKLDAIDTEEW